MDVDDAGDDSSQDIVLFLLPTVAVATLQFVEVLERVGYQMQIAQDIRRQVLYIESFRRIAYTDRAQIFYELIVFLGNIKRNVGAGVLLFEQRLEVVGGISVQMFTEL